MTATVIAISEHRSPVDLRIEAAEASGFERAIKKMSDAIHAAKEPITKQEIMFALLLLKPESPP
jgi:hypothetical protein